MQDDNDGSVQLFNISLVVRLSTIMRVNYKQVPVAAAEVRGGMRDRAAPAGTHHQGCSLQKGMLQWGPTWPNLGASLQRVRHGILSWSRIQMYWHEDGHGTNLLLLAGAQGDLQGSFTHKSLFKFMRTSLIPREFWSWNKKLLQASWCFWPSWSGWTEKTEQDPLLKIHTWKEGPHFYLLVPEI